MKFQIEPFILKKAYCCICGNKLSRKIICIHEETTSKPFGMPFLKGRNRSYLLVLPVYKCKNCVYLIEYDEQKKISKQQKEIGEKILPNGKQLIKKSQVL